MDLDIDLDVQGLFDRAHDFSMDYPAESDALVAGLSVFAWYAMPDFISSPTLRFFGKGAILAGMGSYFYHLPDAEDAIKEGSDAVVQIWKRAGLADQPIPVQVAAGVAVSSAAFWVNSLTERYILHRGERKKAKGKKFPHVKQALVLGGLCAATMYFGARRA